MAWAAIPAMVNGEVLGVFGIYHRHPMHPLAADIGLVTEFTRLAGLAVNVGANIGFNAIWAEVMAGWV